MQQTRLNLAWGTNELPELKPHWDKWFSKSQDKDIYSPSGFFGDGELRNAIAERFLKRYQTEIAQHQITITNGGTEALYTIFQWVKSVDGTVVVQRPAWGYFVDALHLLGIRVQYSNALTANELKDDLNRIHSSGPTLFLLTNPSNPFGHCFSREYLGFLSDWVKSDPANYVLSDEIYDWYANNEEFHSWASVHGLEQSFIVHGYSKPTGLASWRVGYYISSDALIRKLNAFHQNNTYGTTTFSQFMALEAQKEENEIRRLLHHAIQKRRKILQEQWIDRDEIHLLNDGIGMYAFITLPWDKKKQIEFFHRLEHEGEVMITPGESFGIKNGGMRINLTRPIADIEESINIIQSFLTD